MGDPGSEKNMLIDLSEKFHIELSPGERIIWSGQPQKGLLLRQSDGFMIPFSLFWGWFVIFWESWALSTEGSLLFALWGIPFALSGLYLIFGRFFVDSAKRSKTFYVLTTERVIIISGLFTRKTTILDIKKISEMIISTEKNGKKTLTFAASLPPTWWFSEEGISIAICNDSVPCLDMIDDAETIFQHIKRLQKEGL